MSNFAQLMDRTNTAVFERLADATALIEGVPTVMPALFEAEYTRVDVGALGMGSTAPAITVQASRLPTGELVGKAVTVQYVEKDQPYQAQYQIAEEHPDGAGSVLLILEQPS